MKMFTSVLLVVISLSYFHVVFGTPCSLRYISLWSRGYYQARCSSLQLKTVPKDFDKDPEDLYLSWNNITEIRKGDFQRLQKLTKLYLHHNPIKKLSSHVFSSLTKLEVLYVTADHIEDGAFLGLYNLETLVIFGSKTLKTISKSIFKSLPALKTIGIVDTGLTKVDSRLLSGFENLATVYLQRNEIAELEPNVFDGSTKIQRIFLHGNRLSNISETYFQNLPNLEQLKLSDNHIKIIDKNAFSSSKKLDNLNLGGNLLTVFPIFEGVRLKTLNLSSNHLTNLPSDTASYADSYRSLTHLYLANNQLQSFTSKALELLSLQVLRLQNNSLASVDLQNPIRDLDVSFNCFKSRPQLSCLNQCYMRYCCLTKLPHIRETNDYSGRNLVDLSGNNFTEVTFSGDDRSLHYMNVNLTNCNVKKVIFLASRHGYSPSLQTLDLSNNLLTEASWDFSNAVSITNLTLKNNKITKLGQINGAVESIDISNNMIKSVEKGAFNSMVLRKLLLNDNLIASFHNGTIESIRVLRILNLSGNALSSFDVTNTDTVLETLDLSRNRFAHIPKHINKLFALKHLDFSHNNISSMDGDELNELTNLEILKIRHNNFSTIGYTFFQSNEALKDFDISENHLQCDCNLTITLNKIKNKNLKIYGQCKANSSTVLPIHTLIKPLQELSKSNCNLCPFSPCKHRGKCLPNKASGFQCICDLPYTGRNCEVNTLECFKSQSCGLCNSSTCGQRGQCKEISRTEFQCNCSRGYTGKLCETSIEPCYKTNSCGVCNRTTCKNNGSCIEVSVENAVVAQCQCPKFYSGKFCETNKECLSNASCYDRGVCIKQNGRSICRCNQGYVGDNCEINLPYCQLTQSCGVCKASTCKNKGKCIEINNKDFYCACTGEYIGKYCQIKSSTSESDEVFSKSISVTDLVIILGALLGVVVLACYLVNSKHPNISSHGRFDEYRLETK